MIAKTPSCDRKRLPHKVKIVTRGSPPPPQIISRMEELGFGVNHLYGLTETYAAGTYCLWKPEWDFLPSDERFILKARQGVQHLCVEEVDVTDSITMKKVPADGVTMGEVMFRGNTIVHPSLVPTNQEFKMPFFLTLRYVQTLSDPKVIDKIKIELFGATTITKKIILEGELIVVDGLSGDGVFSGGSGGSGAVVGANDAPLTVFKANYYEYDHTGYTDFASPSKCSACKCQDCRAKHDVVINAINALTTPAKELTSKRGLIPSKRILFPSAPLEIRAKRRRGVISKALSSIQKSEITTPLFVCCTEQRTMSKGEQDELKKVDVEEATAEQH
ncbi:hypothetical protein T459_04395 [Capsicum annuum]|uniref:AMP-dependent synthetase/ligase domain-containing protein n=1 Tax=Capsicum annuum TaxID=4072 RepID=A0A2G3A4X4_CAPAN|nr:hypothetical protein T459_04395 [Capsicum annuum]